MLCSTDTIQLPYLMRVIVFFICSSAAKRLFGKDQSMTSSVTDFVLSPPVPSVYFLTVKN